MNGSSHPRLKLRSDYLAAIVVTMVPVAYFLPALVKGTVLCPDDGLLQNVPFRVAAAQIVLSGHLPLWDPYIFSGMPLLAAAQAGILFPLNWFFLLTSATTASNLMVVSAYMAAGLGAFLYARRTGASIAGALITGLVWQWSGALVGQISHINIVHTAAMLPWLLWSLEAYAMTGSYKRGVLLAALVAIQIFAGHQQTFAYSLILVAAYAMAMAAVNRELRKRYLYSLAFVATGVLLSAIQIVPTFELLRNSPRASASYDFFTSFSMPRNFVLTFFAPYLMGGGDGRLFRAPYFGPPFYPELVGYVGVIALMLALAALLLKPDVRSRFWAIAGLAALLLALGRYAPLHSYRLIYYVPILNLFRVPARHLMELDFALAVLAGRGLTALAAARGKKEVVVRGVIAGASVLLITFLAVTWLRPAGFKLGREAPVTLLRAPELFLPIMLAGAGFVALWAFARGKRGATLALFAFMAIDLVTWGQSSGWYAFSPNRSEEYWRVPEVVQRLREVAPGSPWAYRILTAPHKFNPAIPPVGPSVSRSTDWILWTQPDVYMMHGVQNAAGYDGFGLARYGELAGRMKVWGELTDPDATLRGGSREIDLVNARYLISMRNQTVDLKMNSAATKSFAAATTQFGDYMFAGTDLGLPNIGSKKKLSFTVTPTDCDRVALITNLSWSDNVPEGTGVAQLRLHTADERVIEFELRAGRDSAEWAYDRTDIRARIKHKRPTVATSYEVNDATGPYEGHTYVTSFALPEKAKVVGGEITLPAVPNSPDLALGLFRLSLVDTGGGATYPLSRDWVSVQDVDAPAPAQAVALPAEDRWKLLAQTNYVDIYENNRALPRVWLASDARVMDEVSMLEVIRSGKFPDGSKWDPQQTGLIESEIAERPQPGNGQAQVTRYEPNRVDVSATLSAPALLVLSENHYPGWLTYVDGRRVETLRVDYNLRGVPLSTGSHKIEFVYRPKSVYIGFVLSMLGVAGLVSWGLLSKRIHPQITQITQRKSRSQT